VGRGQWWGGDNEEGTIGEDYNNRGQPVPTTTIVSPCLQGGSQVLNHEPTTTRGGMKQGPTMWRQGEGTGDGDEGTETETQDGDNSREGDERQQQLQPGEEGGGEGEEETTRGPRQQPHYHHHHSTPNHCHEQLLAGWKWAVCYSPPHIPEILTGISRLQVE